VFFVARHWAAGEVRRAYRFVNIQISADYVSLLLWIYLTGGPVSFFLPFFVFHLVLSGLLVSRRMAIVHAGWALVALAAMSIAVTAGVLPSYSPLGRAVTESIRRPVYLSAVMLTTAATLVMIAFLVGGIADRLRGRERELARTQRELEVRSDRLQEAYSRLRQSDKEKSEFYRLVSHQLRAPLSSVQSVLRTITGGYAADAEKMAELAGRAERQSGEMLELINDMLTLTRLEATDEVGELESIDLGRLLRGVVDLVQNAARQKSVELTVELDAALPAIRAVRNRVEQMFAILVENAVKYTPAGGTVHVRGRFEGERVVVSVADTGIGIPAEAQGHIFEEFYRAPNARKHERVGTGLGLSIARKIAEGLGGTIAFESTVGAGTTFSVSLPVSSART
jgi:signal transduction histidine kinase